MSQQSRFQNYNAEHPPKSIRIDKDMWEQIPKPKGPWIQKVIENSLKMTPTPGMALDSDRNRLLLFLIKHFVELGLIIEFPDDQMANLIEQLIPEALQ